MFGCRAKARPVKEAMIAEPRCRSVTLRFELPDPAATAGLARRLAALARDGDVIGLRGDLGVGKTSFARAFINALPGPDGAPLEEEVPSPTFTLVQIYRRSPADVWHFDLYRLERPEEVYELGIEEALAGAIVLIEWPERLSDLLPPQRLDLTLSFASAAEARRAELTGYGNWVSRLGRLEKPNQAAASGRGRG